MYTHLTRPAILFIALSLLYSPGVLAVDEKMDAELLLVGAYVNQKEIRNIDLLKINEEFWLPLKDFSEFMGVKVLDRGEEIEFSTPIGNVVKQTIDIRKYEGELYITDRQMLDWFNILAKLNPMDYAIHFDVPWIPHYQQPTSDKPAREIVPDFKAPAGSLSYLRSRSEYSKEYTGDTSTLDGNVELGGRLLEGTWILSATGNQDQDAEIDRYYWNSVGDKYALRLGAIYTHLNPLLASQQFDGMQFAYNNKSMAKYVDYAGALNQDNMIVDSSESLQNIIRNDGPPGGIAELRINDRPVGYVRIGLDGRYEFLNIESGHGQFQDIKVYLYKRDINEIPVAVLDLTRFIAHQSLDRGELMIRAGAGRETSIEQEEQRAHDTHEAGFLSGRYGLNDRLTLSGAVKSKGKDKIESLAGLRLSLGRNWAFALDSSSEKGPRAYSAELQGLDKDWHFVLRNAYFEKGYHEEAEPDTHDYYLQSLYKINPSIRLGVFGRDSKSSGSPEVKYAKPGGMINLGASLSLSAIPNMDGDYRITGYLYPSKNTRLWAIYDNKAMSATFFYDRTYWNNYTLVYENREDSGKSLVYGDVYYYLDDINNGYLKGGVSRNDKFSGFLASFRWMARPGVEISAEYSDGYRQFEDAEKSRRFSAAINIGLANTSRGITPVNNTLINFSRGGISGGIYRQNGEKVKLDGFKVLVNGEEPSQTSAGGSYYIGNLKPGVYQIEMDESMLPIELTIRKRTFIVEVAAGVVTRVNFEAVELYGAAGQVTYQDGTPAKGMPVYAYNNDGDKVSSSLTDLFGYFRVDSLPPGDYRLNVETGDVTPAPSVMITISDDYLFDRNIVLPFKSQPVGE